MTKIFPLSQEENIVGEDEMLVRVPSLNRKAGKKEYEKKKKKQNGKKLWWPHPFSHFNQKGKTKIFKAPR